jgi:hypothetical protein
MAVIDADAHVIEWERTWEYMDDSDKAFAPRVMVFKDQAQRSSGRSASEYWMIAVGFSQRMETSVLILLERGAKRRI